MTAAHSWNPMPHQLDITCPACGAQARFEFAESVRIRTKADVELFKAHRHLKYRFVEASSGQRWHAAVFYAGLRLANAFALRDLPPGYEPGDWAHSRFLMRSDGEDGSFRCTRCNARRMHRLDWPRDAFYKIVHRGEVLWAFDRATALELRDYIASSTRDRGDHKWQTFLFHVPANFLGRKDRDHVVKALNRVLE